MTSEEYPPRYTEDEQNGLWRLVEDEPEWLARPAPWAIWKLGRTGTQDLFWHHLFVRMIDWFECPVCRPLVLEMNTEVGIEPLAEPLSPFGKFRHWYTARHPKEECDCKQLLRAGAMYQNGVCTKTELFHWFIEALSRPARGDEAWQNGRAQQKQQWERFLALELMGPNPFRPVAFADEWLTSTAVAIARAMYESRDFSPMPVLADALEEAGCDAAEVLAHCRGAGPHVRGCWVVDGVLGLA